MPRPADDEATGDRPDGRPPAAEAEGNASLARDGPPGPSAPGDRYKALFHHLHEGLGIGELIYDAQGRAVDYRYLDVNPAWERMTGLHASGVIGRPITAVIPGVEPHWLATYASVVQTGQPVKTELQASVLGRWFEVHAYRPEPGHFATLLLDITDRRARSEQLQRNAETFYRLIHDNPFGIYLIDSDFRLIEVSRGSRKVFANVDPLLGRDFGEVIRCVWQEPFASDVIARFRHTLETGEGYVSMNTVEQRADVPDTESYDWRIERISLPDGRFGVVCYFYDLTERHELEQSLKVSEERARLATEAGGIGVWDLDLRTGILQWDEKAKEHFGLPATAIVTLDRVKALIHAADHEAIDQSKARALDPGGEGRSEVEYRILRPDGSERWIAGRGQAYFEDGAAVRFVGTLRDVTDRRRAEEALEQSQRALVALNVGLETRVAIRTQELEEANARLAAEMEQRLTTQRALAQSQKLEAVGQLTSGIAHDFNNVIAAISGGFSVIARRVEDPRILRICEHGIAAADRGSALVKQLMAFARQQALDSRTVDLRELLKASLVLVRRTVGPKVVVSATVDPAVPLVDLDPAQLEAALINLAANARDAMPDGGRLSIDVTLFNGATERRPVELDGEATVVINVHDTGVGIPAEVLHRVTEPFFTTKPPGKGTGLGLAMVHGFVAQSGGALRVESEPGQGTTVRLYLPRGAPAPQVAAAAAASPDDLAGQGTVLVVDDDGDVRGIVTVQLEDFGYSVIRAGHGAEALDVVRTRPDLDLVLTDVEMPTMDGVEFARRALALRPDLPVLFMTGQSDRDQLMGKPLLAKPFSPQDLAVAVRRLIAAAKPADAPP